MPIAPDSVSNLVADYRSIVAHASPDSPDSIAEALTRADWTPEAAAHLVRLSKRYGSFMLRNALALSLALGIEDGSLRF